LTFSFLFSPKAPEISLLSPQGLFLFFERAALLPSNFADRICPHKKTLFA